MNFEIQILITIKEGFPPKRVKYNVSEIQTGIGVQGSIRFDCCKLLIMYLSSIRVPGVSQTGFVCGRLDTLRGTTMWSPVPAHTDTILHGYGYSKEYTESPVSLHSDPDVYYRL